MVTSLSEKMVGVLADQGDFLQKNPTGTDNQQSKRHAINTIQIEVQTEGNQELRAHSNYTGKKEWM